MTAGHRLRITAEPSAGLLCRLVGLAAQRDLPAPAMRVTVMPEAMVVELDLAGLDPHHARVLKDILKERSQAGMTIFVSTHQLSVAEEMADRIGIIHNGRLIAVGTRDELRRQSGADGRLEETFLALTAQEANQRDETKR